MPDKHAIDNALKAITEEVYRGRGCWATRLPEEAFEFLLLIERLEADPTQTVSRMVASRKFEELFGIEVNNKTLGSHLNKGCSCHKERDY